MGPFGGPGFGGPRFLAGSGSGLDPERSLDIEETDVLGVALDEVATGFDVLAHEHAEQLVRLGRVVEGDLKKNPVVRIHRGIPELDRRHLAESLVPGDPVVAPWVGSAR